LDSLEEFYSTDLVKDEDAIPTEAQVHLDLCLMTGVILAITVIWVTFP